MNGGMLGWPTWISGDDFVSFKTADGRWFELIERSSDPEYDQPRFQVGFAVDSIEDVHGKLVEMGVEAITPIYHHGDEPWAYFRDEEGLVFSIKQRRPATN